MSTGTQAAKVAGVGVAACAACCAGPILAWLGPVGLGTLGGAALFGVVGLLLGGAAIAAVLWRRRRASTACAVAPADPAAVPIALTDRRT